MSKSTSSNTSLEKSKLIYYLSTFSKKEINRLLDFVHSPYYNKSNEQSKLLEIICKLFPVFDSKKLTKTELHKKVFGTETFVEKKFNNQISLLIKLVEKFITSEQLEHNKTVENFIKLEGLKNKGLDKGFISVVNQIESKKSNSPVSIQDQLFIYLTEEEKDNAYRMNNELPYSSSINNKSLLLDNYYIASKLKIHSEMKTRERVFNVNFDKDFLNHTIHFFQTNNELSKDSPLTQLYFDLFNLMNEIENDQLFDAFYSNVIKYSNQIDQDELSIFIQHATNYCIQRVNSGNPNYLHQLFEIYKLQHTLGLLILNNQLHDRTLKNIIEVAIRVKAYQWATEFLSSNIQFVIGDHKEMIKNYNLGNIYCAEEKYKEALRCLTFVQLKDPFYQIAVKTLLTKIYFHLKDPLSVEAQLMNFKSYLKREKEISNQQKSIYNNFSKFLNSILKLQDKITSLSPEEITQKREKLIDELSAEKEVADRTWLNEQLSKF